jgi:hypothetical protein
MLQASHAPPQAVLQHTPSTQLPEVHWLAAVQTAPLDSLVVHVPALQNSLAMHPEMSAGQAVVVPSHVSATLSHAVPPAFRQTKPAARTWSVGHVGELPVHASGASQRSVDTRQVVPAPMYPSLGQTSVPPEQVSAMSQTPAVARQTEPAPRNALDGQSAAMPVQFSATSQGPLTGRHSVEAGRNEFAGQSADAPVQFSGASQTPSAARHCVEFGRKPSAGHAGPVPGQVSAMSHGPLTARQVVAALANLVAHESEEPSHVSSTSQACPEEARHTAPAGRFASSAGHNVDVPEQVSGRSQEPAAGRHTTVVSARRGAQFEVRPSQVSLTSQAPFAT